MKQIFINLPVEDPEKSMNFYAQLGFKNNPLFTDESQKCMVWSEEIFVMLQAKELFKSYNKKPIPDLKNQIAATFTLPVESLDSLNKIMESGLNAAGKEPNPMLDEGHMQVRTLEDLDGHTWSIIYLDLDKFRKE